MLLESVMRLILPASAVGLVLAAYPLASQGQQRPVSAPIVPRSLALQAAAARDVAAGNLMAADDKLETALAVDPRNQRAYVDLARIALAQKLPGKAIRLYREALELAPDDLDAVAGQGEALAAKGATVKARENLARLRTLCKAACPQVGALDAAIARGPIATASVAAPIPKP